MIESYINLLELDVRNLLFVDDESQTLDLLTELYSVENNVYSALNGKEAIEIMSRESIDVLIIDILLAGNENGYNLAQQIKRDNKDIKIALMTSLKVTTVQENYGSDFAILSKLDLVLTADAPGLPNILSDFINEHSIC